MIRFNENLPLVQNLDQQIAIEAIKFVRIHLVKMPNEIQVPHFDIMNFQDVVKSEIYPAFVNFIFERANDLSQEAFYQFLTLSLGEFETYSKKNAKLIFLRTFEFYCLPKRPFQKSYLVSTKKMSEELFDIYYKYFRLFKNIVLKISEDFRSGIFIPESLTGSFSHIPLVELKQPVFKDFLSANKNWLYSEFLDVIDFKFKMEIQVKYLILEINENFQYVSIEDEENYIKNIKEELEKLEKIVCGSKEVIKKVLRDYKVTEEELFLSHAIFPNSKLTKIIYSTEKKNDGKVNKEKIEEIKRNFCLYFYWKATRKILTYLNTDFLPIKNKMPTKNKYVDEGFTVLFPDCFMDKKDWDAIFRILLIKGCFEETKSERCKWNGFNKTPGEISFLIQALIERNLLNTTNRSKIARAFKNSYQTNIPLDTIRKNTSNIDNNEFLKLIPIREKL